MLRNIKAPQIRLQMIKTLNVIFSITESAALASFSTNLLLTFAIKEKKVFHYQFKLIFDSRK